MKIYYIHSELNSIIVVGETREEAYNMICNTNKKSKMFQEFAIDLVKEIDIVPGLTIVITG